jgi:hypothetical protein
MCDLRSRRLMDCLRLTDKKRMREYDDLRIEGTVEAERCEIQFIQEDVYDPDRVVLSDVVADTFVK